jgi:hypothetical protein
MILIANSDPNCIQDSVTGLPYCKLDDVFYQTNFGTFRAILDDFDITTIGGRPVTFLAFNNGSTIEDRDILNMWHAQIQNGGIKKKTKKNKKSTKKKTTKKSTKKKTTKKSTKKKTTKKSTKKTTKKGGAKKKKTLKKKSTRKSTKKVTYGRK